MTMKKKFEKNPIWSSLREDQDIDDMIFRIRRVLGSGREPQFQRPLRVSLRQFRQKMITAAVGF